MINLDEFNRRYKANEFQMRQLFRKYRIKNTGVNGIREGHSRFGQAFLIQAVDIINNRKPESNFSNYNDPTLEPEAYVDDIPFDTSAVAASQKTGKAWDFLGNLLNFGNSAAETIGKVKNAWNGQTTYETTLPEQRPAAKFNFTTIAAIIAFVLLIFLVIRKK